MFMRWMKSILIVGLCITAGCSDKEKSISNNAVSIGSEYKNKSDDFWRQHLSPEVYNICRQKGTERAGSGKFDHFDIKGTYYCACCGGDHAVYSSEAKYDSHTGWPSFWEPISVDSVVLREDREGLFGWAYPRIEVICSRCGGHLGHVFNDGPKEHGGLRYCMNSLALTFVAEGHKPIHRLENG